MLLHFQAYFVMPCTPLKGSANPAPANAGMESEMPYSNALSRIIVPTGLALLLCNMDRIVMSVAILPIAKEFNWAPSTQVYTVFVTCQHPIEQS